MGAAVSRHHRFPAAAAPQRNDPELGLIRPSSRVVGYIGPIVSLPEPSMVRIISNPHQLPKLQPTRTIKSKVNLKKHSLKLRPDFKGRVSLPGQTPRFRLSFEVDALEPCKVTAYVLGYEKSAKAGPNTPPGLARIKSKHTKSGVSLASFGRGLSQPFEQPQGAGLAIPGIEEEQLTSKSGKTIYPLVIRVETSPEESTTGAQHGKDSGVQVQTTFATLIRQADGNYDVQAVKQVLWANGTSYVLHEIFGIDRNHEVDPVGADSSNKECVICLTEVRDTLSLPCRHLCMCAECAKALRYQTNKCPICRCIVESLLVIRVAGGTAGPTMPPIGAHQIASAV